MSSSERYEKKEEHPEILHIEVTNRCNFDCIMCIRRRWNAKLTDFNVDLYKNIVRSSFPKLKRLALYGFGEPFVNPKLPLMLELSRKYLSKESEVMISTNGSLLVPRLSERLLKGKWIDELSFSIDTLDAGKLSRVRGGSKPEAIIQNLQYLTKGRNRSERELKIGIEVVIMKDNIEDLPNLVESVAEKDLDYIAASHVVPYTREMYENSAYITLSRRSLEIIHSSAEYDKVLMHNAAYEILAEMSGIRAEPKVVEAYKKLLDKALESGYWINLPLLIKSEERIKLANQAEECFRRSERIANEYGLEVRFPTVFPDAKKRSCPYVDKNAIFIRSDGKVAPCMSFAYSHRLYVNMHIKRVHEVIVGDLRKETPEVIWNNENYRAFRDIRKNITDNITWCGDCQFSMGCFFAATNDRDCYGNAPGCGECLYSAGLSRCNM